MPSQDKSSEAGDQRTPAQVICWPLPASAPVVWYVEMGQGHELASMLGQIGELSEPPEAEIGLQLKVTCVRSVCRPAGTALKPAYAIPLAIYTNKSQRTGTLRAADGRWAMQCQMVSPIPSLAHSHGRVGTRADTDWDVKTDIVYNKWPEGTPYGTQM
jgi:hypothetical protein